MGDTKGHNHTSALLESLELLTAEAGCPDLRIICQDGVWDSYRLLLGSCSELLRACLEPDGEDSCIILPNVSVWEIQAFHSALLCYKDTPTNEELDAVLKVLSTIGGNVGQYVHVNITAEPTDISDVTLVSFVNTATPIQEPVKSEELTLVIPSSLNVFPIQKGRRTYPSSNSLEVIVRDAENTENKRLAEESVDDVEPDHHQHNQNLNHVIVQSKFTCPFCEKDFRTLAPYEKHLLDHQKEKTGYSQLDPLSFHDNNKTSFNCSLSYCDKSFGSAKELRLHQKDHLNLDNIAQIECTICAKVFGSKSSLSNHMKSHDESSKLKRFLCDICKKVFNHPSNLKRHIKHVHTDDFVCRNHPCLSCGKRFKEASVLKTHMESHNEVRQFPCGLCTKSYAKKSQLVTHMRCHTGEKPFTCNLCGKSFYTTGNLKSHKLNRHVGVKLSKSHLCPDCGQGYIKEYDLRVHMRRHRGEKPYSCFECGKCFHSERNFVDHTRTHTGAKPYQCETCKKQFSSSAGLRQHFKSYANCRLQATEGAYSICPEKRSEWQRLGGLQILNPEFIIQDSPGLHNLEDFTVQDEETVVYLAADTTDLSLVSGGIIQADIVSGGITQADIDGQVDIQTLPMDVEMETNGEVLNLVEMSENL